MKFNEFADLVRQMRDAQRRYFGLRRNKNNRQDAIDEALSIARELEKRVDAAIDDIANSQKRLF